jgi:3-phenylpropionate/trans-cinnamate dioxygenase ferredoxin reductase subunit
LSGRIVIVGASLGGLRAAEQIRAFGWSGELLIIGQERHMPYTRPPLSKELLRTLPSEEQLGAAERAHAGVAFPIRRTLAAASWELGVSVTHADLDEDVIQLSDGRSITYDGLVVATGLRPRHLSIPGPRSGRHVVRTLDDVIRLRPALQPGATVVLVGGGFIGCEVAATARTLGCEVVVVEPLETPMAQALGEELGRALQAYHEARGVGFRLGRAVAAAMAAERSPDRVASLVLDDDTRLSADVVVEAIGCHPNVEWLAGNGLDLGDGVLCDNLMRVEGHPDVVAVGDIARFPNPLFDAIPRRVEHWSMPTNTAKRAAATLVRHLVGARPDADTFAPVPTFWSDQFDLRLQSVGAPELGERTEPLEGDLDSDCAGLTDGVAVGYYANSHLVGAVLVGLPPSRVIPYRRLLAESSQPVLSS